MPAQVDHRSSPSLRPENVTAIEQAAKGPGELT
jgi:hypothetical protein